MTKINDKQNVMEIPYCTLVDSLVRKVAEIVKQRFVEKDISQEEFRSMMTADYQKTVQESQESHKGIYRGLMNPLFEAMPEQPSDFEKIKSKLQWNLHLKDWQFEFIDPFELGQPDLFGSKTYSSELMTAEGFQTVIVPDIKSCTEEVASVVKHYGYTLVRSLPWVQENPETHETYPVAIMIFVQEKRFNIVDAIKKFKVLYHISLRKNRDNIVSDGLKTAGRDGSGPDGITYPPRIYFFRGDCRDEAIEYAQQIIAQTPGASGDLYTIDLKKVSINTAFYYDQLIGKSAVYCENDIPAKAIIKVEAL